MIPTRQTVAHISIDLSHNSGEGNPWLWLFV